MAVTFILSENNLGVDGGKAIAKALKSNNTIQIIDVSSTPSLSSSSASSPPHFSFSHVSIA